MTNCTVDISALCRNPLLIANPWGCRPDKKIGRHDTN